MINGDAQVPLDDNPIPRPKPQGGVNAAVQRHWRSLPGLSSIGDGAERFLDGTGFDKGPWLVVAFAGGIASWFLLDDMSEWLTFIAGCATLMAFAAIHWRGRDDRVGLARAVVALALMAALGLSVIWARSAMIGAAPVDGPSVSSIAARILEREEQPAEGRTRLILAIRDAESGAARKVRVNVPIEADRSGFVEGAVIRLRARLLPPAPPMLPGSYDFARAAWFQGLAATGSALGEIALVEAAPPGGGLAPLQRRLADHVRARLGGSPGAIAAAFASGDRGAIAEADDAAMRDAGLTHLLSISGLHVSAVVAGVYFIAIRLLALWPWLALWVRLPLVAAGAGALAGVAYTLLTGAEVPTVRSCAGAVLVLIALALGREPLSMRMVSVAALFVLLLWPESLVGPSFQMSFAAVLAIVALGGTGWVRRIMSSRDERAVMRAGRWLAMLLLTGVVIEIALMPIVLFHFHRAGLYGSLANVVAIPLVTFVTMPLIAFALLLDLLGAGAPLWYLAGKSIELLLWIAHVTAAQPGAVSLMPQMGGLAFALFVAGGVWLALWQGRVRLAGLAPVVLALLLFMAQRTPDVFITGDGRHVGIHGEGPQLLVLRDGRSDFVRDNLLELAGVAGDPVPLDQWPGARCSADFCTITLRRGGQPWHVLMARSRERVEELALAAACERADIVISDRWLPVSCRPRWLKADRRMLSQTGGLAIDLAVQDYTAAADSQGAHGWWRPDERR